IFQPRAYHDFLIVINRCSVAANGFGDGDEAVFLAFHVAVGEAQLAHEFDTANFEPDQMVRMVDHTHLIGLGITHAKLGLVNHQVVANHLPLQTGLRFSRNEATPSRKSAVVRMRALSSMASAICRLSCVDIKPLINFLVAWTDDGLFSRICAASSLARANKRSGGMISLTRP